MRKRIVVAALATVFLFVIVLIPTGAYAQPTAEGFGPDSGNGKHDEVIVIPVRILNVKNGPVQGIRCELEYDENVLTVVNISRGELTSAWSKLELGKDKHTVAIATTDTGAAIPDGSSGSVAHLQFRIIGSSGELSQLRMAYIELSNPEGVIGTAPATSGMITVTESGESGGGAGGGGGSISDLFTPPTPTATETPPEMVAPTPIETETPIATVTPGAPTPMATPTPIASPTPPLQASPILRLFIVVTVVISVMLVLAGYFMKRM